MWGLSALDDADRRTKLQQKRERAPIARQTLRAEFVLPHCLTEAGNHFRRGAGDGRAIAGLFRILAGLCRQAGQAEVLSQKLWLGARDFGESLLQMAPTGFVKTASLREKEAFVGSVA